MKEEKGITLIALIITIILLLILAGVVLNITLGENGLFKTASGAAKKYKLEEMRERIELAISDIVTKEIILGNEITVENVLQELLENGTFETIDKEAGVGTIDKYDVTLKKNEDGSIVIESIEETTGVRITYKLDPISYTNSEKVTIQFKVVGEVKNVTKPNGEVAYPNQGKAEINYEVDKNGTYKFMVENKEGILVEKEVLVDTIDRLPPLGFTITANQVEDKLVVMAKAEDQEADGTSIKSGIDRYEYFVKKATDTAYPETPYTTNEIEISEYGTYNVYAIAYDKAENTTQSEPIEVRITIKIAKVATGENYSLFIDEDGNLYGVGNNRQGQLGDGTTTNRTTPIQIKVGTKFKEVAAGPYKYTLAIDIEGNLWAWGYNNQGQLGDGTTTNRTTPVQVKEGTKFKEVAVGGETSCAIDEDGNLWMWGNNRQGQLGDGTTTNRTTPVQVKEGTKFRKVAMGYGNSYAIDEDENLWGCGIGYVGDGGDTTRKLLVQIKAGTKFKEIACGSTNDYKYAIDADGNLWGWGDNGQGQLGDGTTTDRTTPVQIKAGTKFKKIALCVQSDVNVSHSLAIDEEGNLWASGRNNSYGVLGNNSTTTTSTQVQIKAGTRFKEIAASRYNSYAIDEDGKLWAWGFNGYGQLVNGTTTDSKIPVQAF